ncbi:MAG: polyketide synthase dehydratase domain-containing protein [Phycisphaerae bacterium]|nr:polyketide synthase dehydratase domain-containing protein [Phycisphaerae bacterium]
MPAGDASHGGLSADESPEPGTSGDPLSGELSLSAVPVLSSHVVAGRPVVPLALMLEWLAREAAREPAGGPGAYCGICEVRDLRVLRPLTVDARPQRWAVRRIDDAVGTTGTDATARVQVVCIESGREPVVHATATIAFAERAHDAGEFAMTEGARGAHEATIDETYRNTLFHGRALRLIERVDGIDESGARARVRCDALPGDWISGATDWRWLTNPPSVDAALQLGIVWTSRQRGLASLPMVIGSWRMIAPAWPAADCVDAVLAVRSVHGSRLRADVAFIHEGRRIAEMRSVDWIMDASLAAIFRAQAAADDGARR